MKKTAISLMLVLAMVLSVVLVAAPKAEAVDHTAHCVCGGTLAGKNVDGHSCTTAETWTELTLEVLQDCNYDLPSGNYYLSGTLTLEKRIFPVASSTVTICLNGQQLLGANTTADSGRVLNANRDNTVLNVCDCKGTGRIASTSTEAGKYAGGIIQIGKESAKVNLFGGTIVGRTVVEYTSGSNTKIPNAGTIYQSAGTLNMYGGTLEGGTAPAAGGSVYNKAGSTFNMYGGMIKDGNSTASNGGNVAVYGSFKMEGGTISGGTASDRGGNLFINGTAASITGGTVTGGSDKHYAGIHVNGGKTFTVGTNAIIQSAVYSTDAATLTLNANWNDEITLVDNMTIDLNGFQLGGTVTTGEHKLYIADSSATAAGTAGTGSVGAAIADKVSVQETGKRFVLVNGVAHRIYIGVTDVSLVLDGKNVGMGYTTGFQADADVAALIESFGIEVYLKNGTPVVCTKNGSEFVAGTDNKATAHVNNILKDGTDVAHLATEVCAKTFVVIDGEKIYSNEYAFSLQTILQKMDAKANELPAAAADLLAEIEGYYGADFFAAN